MDQKSLDLNVGSFFLFNGAAKEMFDQIPKKKHL